jgi:hypothetical protein
MKQKLFISLAILMLSVMAANAQNLQSSYSKMIVGTWKVDSLELGSLKLSPEYEKMIREKMPEIIAMTEVKFSSNKKYYKKGMEGVTEGTWSISKDGQYVLVKFQGETEVTKTKIVSLTNEKLIMAPDDPNAVNSKAYMYKVK